MYNSGWSNKRAFDTFLGKGSIRPYLTGGSIQDDVRSSRGIELSINTITVDNTRWSNNNGISILFSSKASTEFNFSLAELGVCTISMYNSGWSNKRALGTLLGKGAIRPYLSGGSVQNDITSCRDGCWFN